VASLLGLFLIFGVFGEYVYILFVSTLFFYFNIKIADLIFSKLSTFIDRSYFRLIFYVFSLSFFVLIYGTKEGSELLSLTFFIAFIYFLFINRISGYFLGLAFLSRYNFLIFLPLLFFNKSFKKIGLNFLGFFIVILPWFLFNYFKFGNPFVSIINSYALNFAFKEYLFKPFEIGHLTSAIGLALPFFIFGFLISVYYLFNKYQNKTLFVLFFLLTLLTLYDYGHIPYKLLRYLFNFSFPIAFFSSIGFLFFLNLFKKRAHILTLGKVILFLFFLFSLISAAIAMGAETQFTKTLNSAAKDIQKLNLSNCEILTPYWTQISYFYQNAYALGRNDVAYSLNHNKIILIFNNTPTIDDIFNRSYLEENVKLKETRAYTFYVDKDFSYQNCSKKFVFVENYFNDVCPFISDQFNQPWLANKVEDYCILFNRYN
jgi:hypothetical protein